MGEEIITDDEVAMHKRPVVYVSNLPYEARVEDLEGVFEQEGISVVHIEVLKKGKAARLKSSGLACVTLEATQDSGSCCEKLDGKELYGRPIAVKINKFE